MEWQGLDFIGVGLLVFLRQYKVRRRAPINAAALLAASVAECYTEGTRFRRGRNGLGDSVTCRGTGQVLGRHLVQLRPRTPEEVRDMSELTWRVTQRCPQSSILYMAQNQDGIASLPCSPYCIESAVMTSSAGGGLPAGPTGSHSICGQGWCMRPCVLTVVVWPAVPLRNQQVYRFGDLLDLDD